jgi:hypothetical protein
MSRKGNISMVIIILFNYFNYLLNKTEPFIVIKGIKRIIMKDWELFTNELEFE